MPEVTWLFLVMVSKKSYHAILLKKLFDDLSLILVEHAKKDIMGPRNRGIQEKRRINGTSREAVMMIDLSFKTDLKKKTSQNGAGRNKEGTSK